MRRATCLMRRHLAPAQRPVHSKQSEFRFRTDLIVSRLTPGHLNSISRIVNGRSIAFSTDTTVVVFSPLGAASLGNRNLNSSYSSSNVKRRSFTYGQMSWRTSYQSAEERSRLYGPFCGDDTSTSPSRAGRMLAMRCAPFTSPYQRWRDVKQLVFFMHSDLNDV